MTLKGQSAIDTIGTCHDNDEHLAPCKPDRAGMYLTDSQSTAQIMPVITSTLLS